MSDTHEEFKAKAEVLFNKAKGDWSNIKGPARRATAIDGRHVYGAGCSWNGPITNIGTNGGLPACPHCRGMLFEQDAGQWHADIEDYAAKKNDRDYPKFMAWLSTRGKCSPLRTQNDLNALRSEFINLHLI